MIYTDTAAERLANIAAHSRPSPIGNWLEAARRRLAPAKAPPSRDRAREAAELRDWAVRVRQSNPRFADDLFAAAHRHEAMET